MISSIKRQRARAVSLPRRPPAVSFRTGKTLRCGKRAGLFKKEDQKPSQTERFFLKLGSMVLICFFVFLFVASIRVQHGNRMYPFLMDGDVLVIYKLGDYGEGDVVLYRNPETGEKNVSRIAAAGRNEILITEEGQLLINRFVPDGQVFYPTKPLEGSELLYPYQMEEGGCFLLDDFRTQGMDSRWFGEIQEKEILGKVVYVFRRRGI